MINGTIINLYIPNTGLDFYLNKKTAGYKKRGNVKFIGTMIGSDFDKMMYLVIFEDDSELLIPNDIAIVHYETNKVGTNVEQSDTAHEL